MSVELNELDGLQRSFHITVPADVVDSAYKKHMAEVAKNANIQGFRKGKVPEHVIEMRFKKQLLQEVASELVQSQFQQAVQAHELRIAGGVSMEPQQELKKGQPFDFNITFDVYPDVSSLVDLSGEALERIAADLEDNDIDTMLDKIRRQRATWTDVERKAATGDVVVIDFEGFIEDKAFEGGAGTDFRLELGSGQMIPGFEDGLMGVSASDELDLKVTFPEDYSAADLAGKESVFKVKVKNVQEATLPEMDDEFVKAMGVSEGGLDKLKDSIRERMQDELKNQLDAHFKSVVLDKLLSLNALEVPDSLVDQEISHMQRITAQQMAASQGKSEASDMKLPREPYIDEATKRVKLGLMLAEIVKRFEIKADGDLVRQRIEAIAATYERKDEVVQWYYQNDKMLAEIESVVLEDQVVKKLLEGANIEDKVLSYQEAMDLNKK